MTAPGRTPEQTTADRWSLALLVATAVHAGFQATVTGLVYPALARVADDDFPTAHDAHSRRITPFVVVVYAGALATCVGAARTRPGSSGTRVAVAGTAAAFLVTATSAAPTHGRLGTGRTDALITRLLRVDRLRLVGSLVALAGAATAAGSPAAGRGRRGDRSPAPGRVPYALRPRSSGVS